MAGYGSKESSSIVRVHGLVAAFVKHLQAISSAPQYTKDLVADDVPVVIHDAVFSLITKADRHWFVSFFCKAVFHEITNIFVPARDHLHHAHT